MINLKNKEQIILSKLLNEINDASLEMILRRVLFGNENLLDVIEEERPELNNL